MILWTNFWIWIFSVRMMHQCRPYPLTLVKNYVVLILTNWWCSCSCIQMIIVFRIYHLSSWSQLNRIYVMLMMLCLLPNEKCTCRMLFICENYKPDYFLVFSFCSFEFKDVKQFYKLSNFELWTNFSSLSKRALLKNLQAFYHYEYIWSCKFKHLH